MPLTLPEWKFAAAPPPELVRKLLREADLPTADITAEKMATFFSCEADGEIAGLVGLEVHGTVALLRSLVVRPRFRSHGLGAMLLAYAELAASMQSVARLYLLTTTATGFFLRRGYRPALRDDAPEAIRNTAEFAGLCPGSATFMVKRLGAAVPALPARDSTRFHLSFQVEDGARSKRFYTEVLGCNLGRETPTWFDLDFFGHQVTIHQGPGKASDPRMLDHFGVILDKAGWQSLLRRLEARELEFRVRPRLTQVGHDNESGKFVISDPDGLGLEFKYYVDANSALSREVKQGTC
jgi:extradiol dioxygenase family protein/N-acetylglutamate synthase-like GNAT family acetyltransferase